MKQLLLNLLKKTPAQIWGEKLVEISGSTNVSALDNLLKEPLFKEVSGRYLDEALMASTGLLGHATAVKLLKCNRADELSAKALARLFKENVSLFTENESVLEINQAILAHKEAQKFSHEVIAEVFSACADKGFSKVLQAILQSHVATQLTAIDLGKGYCKALNHKHVLIAKCIRDFASHGLLVIAQPRLALQDIVINNDIVAFHHLRKHYKLSSFDFVNAICYAIDGDCVFGAVDCTPMIQVLLHCAELSNLNALHQNLLLERFWKAVCRDKADLVKVFLGSFMLALINPKDLLELKKVADERFQQVNTIVRKEWKQYPL